MGEGGSGMNRDTLDYVLVCVDNAMMELEYAKLEDIPNDIQREFIQAHTLLSHISTALEMKLEDEEEEL